MAQRFNEEIIMQLYLNATSPFARFARIFALEKGLNLELIWCDPWQDDPALLAINPLGRVPALKTHDTCLAESTLIALYLDQQKEPYLLPQEQYAAQLRQLGLGIGLMEAAFNRVISRKHAIQSPLELRRDKAIIRTLTSLEAETFSLPNVGSLSVAVALEYLAFRLPEYKLCASLQALQKEAHQRASFIATAFR